ncbi:hypothetical protein T484DRAFT_1770165 [Baffinella frigidus]|nr:hypothetical protein T484DRAFT_1770165 [Cryptophyta sp. CCMP2293]
MPPGEHTMVARSEVKVLCPNCSMEVSLQVAVALEYLNEVRTRFASDPTVYAQFLEMVKELKSEVQPFLP